MALVETTDEGAVRVITLNRPEARNAVDGPTARALADAFRDFDAEETAAVAVLTGSGGTFCAGADLKAVGTERGNQVHLEGDGPMGPTRMELSKPVIAAIEGFAVAGGLELACWCDLRVMASNASFGVYCRRFGVPLIDGGTVRLPRLIGESRALDMILTGRRVDAHEALAIGLANRVVEPGHALDHAIELARSLAALPQGCLRSDRASARSQWGLTHDEAMAAETSMGIEVLASGESLRGAAAFTAGAGRHGTQPSPPPSMAG